MYIVKLLNRPRTLIPQMDPPSGEKLSGSTHEFWVPNRKLGDQGTQTLFKEKQWLHGHHACRI